MNIINSELLDILSKKYALSTPVQCDEFFTQYLVTNKRKKAYLFLVNDYNIKITLNYTFDMISSIDKNEKGGFSYIIMMSAEKIMPEMSFYFNGKSFIHYVFFNEKREVVFFKDFFYSDSKFVKEVIRQIVECLNSVQK